MKVDRGHTSGGQTTARSAHPGLEMNGKSWPLWLGICGTIAVVLTLRALVPDPFLFPAVMSVAVAIAVLIAAVVRKQSREYLAGSAKRDQQRRDEIRDRQKLHLVRTDSEAVDEDDGLEAASKQELIDLVESSPACLRLALLEGLYHIAKRDGHVSRVWIQWVGQRMTRFEKGDRTAFDIEPRALSEQAKFIKDLLEAASDLPARRD